MFDLNGWSRLEMFRELESTDLDSLCIYNPQHRAKILTAVQLLHDLQCEYQPPQSIRVERHANLISRSCCCHVDVNHLPLEFLETMINIILRDKTRPRQISLLKNVEGLFVVQSLPFVRSNEDGDVLWYTKKCVNSLRPAINNADNLG